MPCYSKPRPNQTIEQRKAQVMAALRRLEAQLASGTVTVVIGPSGAVAFAGWSDRDDVTDVCAYRALSTMKSQALSRAVAAAELRAGGVKVNAQAIAAGWHSHDDGKTWGRH